MDFKYRIEYSSRRRNLAVTEDLQSGCLVVKAPAVLTERAVVALIERHREELERRFAVMRERLASPYRFEVGRIVPYLGRDYTVALRGGSGEDAFPRAAAELKDGCVLVSSTAPERVRLELENFYITSALRILPEMVSHLAERSGLDCKKLTVTGTRGRWGSCNSQGCLRFSWRLLFFPPEVVESVVAHELAHRREMNHSEKFYRVWESMSPGYREASACLKKQGGWYGFL